MIDPIDPAMDGWDRERRRQQAAERRRTKRWEEARSRQWDAEWRKASRCKHCHCIPCNCDNLPVGD